MLCPRPDCPRHHLGQHEPYTDFIDWGAYSTQTFRVDYYAKRLIDYSDLLLHLASTSSLSRTRRPSEDLAADGFESFCVSQYFPNNITILVGEESQFVYAADHVTLRRKGRMTFFRSTGWGKAWSS